MSVSRYDEEQFTETDFFANYDPFNPSTYRENPMAADSGIEPKKSAVKVPVASAQNEVQVNTYTTTVQTFQTIGIPIPPRQNNNWSRGGDDGGDDGH